MLEATILQRLKLQKTTSIPIWIMRQAGRYLPEYIELKKKIGSFNKMCENPDIACEVTLLPLKRFPELDAAIIFSDILLALHPLGLKMRFSSSKGLSISKNINSSQDIDKLHKILPNINLKDDLDYVYNAIKLVKKEIKIPLFGFTGSPFTLASYAIEGGSSKDFLKIYRFIYENPQATHNLLKILSEITYKHLINQVEAGANILQIFDSWGHILTDNQYLEYSLSYINKIIIKIQDKYPKIPIVYYSRLGDRLIKNRLNSPATALGINSNANIENFIKNNKAIQGNFNPAILYADKQIIKKSVINLLNQVKDFNGFIFNLGEGIFKDIDVNKVKILIDTIKNKA